MSIETLFALTSLPVLPLWALMILLPRWSWTQRIIRSPLIALAPALIYIVLVLPRVGEVWSAVSGPELAGIAALLGTPAGAAISWAHFLAFDLLVGRWIFLDSRERGVNAVLMAPLLYLTLMLGPVGFVLYLIVRALWPVRSQVVLPESAGGRA
jgi:hypothetical protein